MPLKTPAQLSLPVSLPDDETFDSFYSGHNQVLIAAIQSVLKQPQASYLYFWSLTPGAGRSHLLHAACSEFSANGQAVGYVPLEQYRTFAPEVLEGMEQLALLCIDNISAIAGKAEWELALFNLYNRIREKGVCRLLISSSRPPRQLPFQLADLVSRLEWGQTYRLTPLRDEEKVLALQLRARLRGFELPEEVGHFLLKRLDRRMRNLFQVLDRLDYASISAQRKLTIPFVKEILRV